MDALLVFFAALLSLGLRLSAALPVSYHGQSILKAHTLGADGILQSLRDADVIPDVLPKSFEPIFALDITYPSSHKSVSLGNTIPVKSTSSRPVFEASPLSALSLAPTRTLAENKTYTLVLADPDATSRAEPVKAQMCHWIATGIKLHRINETEGAGAGEAVTYALDLKPIEYASPGPTEGVDALRELVKYMAPAPPPKTGKHRYIFVLLEPEDGQGGSKDEPQAPKERPHFGYGKQGAGVMEWARDNSLRPVAANFFYAQNKKQ